MTAGVGPTAEWIAHARAAESVRADRLFEDPLAVAFTARSNPPLLAEFRAAPTPRFDVLAVRTRFFDQYLTRATEAARLRQVVLLAAGLDSRAYRLRWPPGTRVFELDLPELLEAKAELIQQAELAAATCERRTVAADLRLDWPAELRAAGFDPAAPTAWLVEGLLYYLTQPQVDAVLAELGRLSAPGSRLGLEQVNTDTYQVPWMQDWLAGMRAEGRPWQSGVAEPEPWLAGHGWAADVVEPGELPSAAGRRVPRTPAREVPGVARTWLVTAHLLEGGDTTELGAEARQQR
ncbi:SAM-dependent methyltransferase [Streptomyces tateyamensis]|uniref:S-adenosyl-L-methionine-dependent methyltransferase n=1 Tax=Streptomyces tateyamensis TaxID=565073 RepID=A0A2V4NA60_9ACTN|nr:SAM-dependent methyltransferase [Streptomyces tateyamensis]AXG25738.1 methyltransferase [Streptomyces tateyamensis]PYC80210.1 SAM-dependent methyltransferase [Streptomyces tateyamensis]